MKIVVIQGVYQIRGYGPENIDVFLRESFGFYRPEQGDSAMKSAITIQIYVHLMMDLLRPEKITIKFARHKRVIVD
jgi:hypothetical protein